MEGTTPLFEALRVFVRLRPITAAEERLGCVERVHISDDKRALRVSGRVGCLEASCDHILGPQCTQADVFEAVRPVLDGLPEGISGTILAFGASGTGKTYTMLGGSAGVSPPAPLAYTALPPPSPSDPAVPAASGTMADGQLDGAGGLPDAWGIIPRATVYLLSLLSSHSRRASSPGADARLRELEQAALARHGLPAPALGDEDEGAQGAGYTYRVTASYLQVYMDDVYDLLAVSEPARGRMRPGHGPGPGARQGMHMHVRGLAGAGKSTAGLRPGHAAGLSHAAGPLPLREAPAGSASPTGRAHTPTPTPTQPSSMRMQVVGLSEHPVHSVHDVLRMLAVGNSRRAVRGTDVNDASSRSHAILQLKVVGTPRGHGLGLGLGLAGVRTGVLNLVDLAGSERWRMPSGLSTLIPPGTPQQQQPYTRVSLAHHRDSAREREREMVSINKSLSALGNVISALAQGQEGVYVPYRDSALTRLLRHGLGGTGARAALIATLAPCQGGVGVGGSLEEATLRTLAFASRAAQVKLSLTPDVRVSEAQQLAEAREEINRLRAALAQAQRQGLGQAQAQGQGEAVSPATQPVAMQDHKDQAMTRGAGSMGAPPPSATWRRLEPPLLPTPSPSPSPTRSTRLPLPAWRKERESSGHFLSYPLPPPSTQSKGEGEGEGEGETPSKPWGHEGERDSLVRLLQGAALSAASGSSATFTSVRTPPPKAVSRSPSGPVAVAKLTPGTGSTPGSRSSSHSRTAPSSATSPSSASPSPFLVRHRRARQVPSPAPRASRVEPMLSPYFSPVRARGSVAVGAGRGRGRGGPVYDPTCLPPAVLQQKAAVARLLAQATDGWYLPSTLSHQEAGATSRGRRQVGSHRRRGRGREALSLSPMASPGFASPTPARESLPTSPVPTPIQVRTLRAVEQPVHALGLGLGLPGQPSPLPLLPTATPSPGTVPGRLKSPLVEAYELAALLASGKTPPPKPSSHSGAAGPTPPSASASAGPVWRVQLPSPGQVGWQEREQDILGVGRALRTQVKDKAQRGQAAPAPSIHTLAQHARSPLAEAVAGAETAAAATKEEAAHEASDGRESRSGISAARKPPIEHFSPPAVHQHPSPSPVPAPVVSPTLRMLQQTRRYLLSSLGLGRRAGRTQPVVAMTQLPSEGPVAEPQRAPARATPAAPSSSVSSSFSHIAADAAASLRESDAQVEDVMSALGMRGRGQAARKVSPKKQLPKAKPVGTSSGSQAAGGKPRVGSAQHQVKDMPSAPTQQRVEATPFRPDPAPMTPRSLQAAFTPARVSSLLSSLAQEGMLGNADMRERRGMQVQRVDGQEAWLQHSSGGLQGRDSTVSSGSSIQELPPAPAPARPPASVRISIDEGLPQGRGEPDEELSMRISAFLAARQG